MAYQKTKIFTQLIAPGITAPLIVTGLKNHNMTVKVTNVDTNVIVEMEGSIDGTNFFDIPIDNATDVDLGAFTKNRLTITDDGTFSLHVKNYPMKEIQFRFVTESGGTAALLDVIYYGES